MNNHTNYKIGIIGIGVLGSAIAKCILDQKVTLYGFDISKKFLKNLNKNYFKFCSSIKEVFKNTDVIITCLPTEQSLLEISNNISSKKLIIETSTLPVECKNNAKKLILMNSIGLMDSSYRGNIKGYFFNTSSSPVTISKGEKVLNVALPNLSRNYRLNLFEEQEDIQDHPIREQQIQAEYFPTPFNEIY